MNRRGMLKLAGAALAGAALSRRAPAATEQTVRIEFTLFSAFYSPLIATIAGGFLEAEGLKAVYTVSAPGRSALASLDAGTADVVQSAPSQAFTALEKGQRPSAVHFASINQKDGFFLAAREPDAQFRWSRLKGRQVLVTPGVQPTTMFRYACYRGGVDPREIDIVDAAPPDAMIEAFRAGAGDYIHLQGPAPQQLEHDGAGHIVTPLADVIGPCAFSSLAARRDWLQTPQAAAFMRAYRNAQAWLLSTSPSRVTAKESAFFNGIDPGVLTQTIGTYQMLGNWTPDVQITRAQFDATRDIFQHAGLIHRRYAYEDVVVAPPAG